MKVSEDVLFHFGVLGMRWGHRKQIERDPSDRRVVVKKGGTVGHVTGDGNFRIKDGPLYIYHDKHDRDTYTSWFPYGRVDNAHEVLAKTKVDLITPNKQKRVDAFIDTFNKTPDEVLTEMGRNTVRASIFFALVRYATKNHYDVNPAGEKGLEKIVAERSAKRYKKLIESGRRKDLEEAYLDFNGFLLISDSNRKKYFDTLKKEGFNAVMDDNDIINSGTRSPVIVFDPRKTLKVESVEKISDKQIDDAFDAFNKDKKKVESLIKEDQARGWSAV